MPQLHFEEEGRALFVHVLTGGRTVIGRSDQCDLALPSESVSRVHCVVELGRDGWRLFDRSRHGTRLNGEPVNESLLADGDWLQIGTYHIRFSDQLDTSLRVPTATAPLPTRFFEELLDVSEEGVASARIQLRATQGRHTGRLFELVAARTSVGGHGADIELDRQLPSQAMHIRVARGRAMVEPGGAAVFLAGTRVRTLTPAFPGEEVRLGEHGLLIELDTSYDSPQREVFGDMVANSSVMRRLFGTLSRMAQADSPVLLVGESGTGKELAARAIHDHSAAAEGPFVAVNCAAIAQNLFESELFGHVRGAFTGANEDRDGAFHRASGGTLFLDEVGEIQLDLQAKLLRALESGEVRRVGGQQPTFPDVRVLAATNRPLADMARIGRFREDLYWRLAVLTARMPSLRERLEDLPILARTLLARHHPGARLSDDALEALAAHDWPGNVRELRNVLTRAYVMAGDHIRARDLAFHPWSFDSSSSPAALPFTTRDVELRRVQDALRQAEGNRTVAAQLLGIPRSTMLYKMERFGLKPVRQRRPRSEEDILGEPAPD